MIRQRESRFLSACYYYGWTHPSLFLVLLLLILSTTNHDFATAFQGVFPTKTSAQRSATDFLCSSFSSLYGGTASSSSSLSSSSSSSSSWEVDDIPDMTNVGFVLLAGGKGSRMKATVPKQFLQLRGIPVLQHSLELLLRTLPSFLQQQQQQHQTSDGDTTAPTSSVVTVLVMDPMYQPEYQYLVDDYPGTLAFANPGIERQGSVENGVNALVQLAKDHDRSIEYVAIHDSARPLVTVEEICRVVQDAKQVGAAVLGVPCKATIKESDDGITVLRTIPRARLWEVHTPQVIKIDTLQRGFTKVQAEHLEVTDDVSIVEALGEPVKLTLGEYTNLKITTPEDMDVASAILEDREQKKETQGVKASAASSSAK